MTRDKNSRSSLRTQPRQTPVQEDRRGHCGGGCSQSGAGWCASLHCRAGRLRPVSALGSDVHRSQEMKGGGGRWNDTHCPRMNVVTHRDG